MGKKKKREKGNGEKERSAAQYSVSFSLEKETEELSLLLPFVIFKTLSQSDAVITTTYVRCARTAKPSLWRQ